LKHNVCGRRIYAEGTADAILFLSKIQSTNIENKKRLFNMIDVLEYGEMK
jgi:4-hydroxy-tetrahydrodipicolinate reductase